MLLTRREKFIVPAWPPLRRVLQAVLRDHGCQGILSVALVTDEEIARIHGEYLGDERPTDVISFPLLEKGVELPHEEHLPPAERMFGEIVVSGETALREAKKRGLSPERELALYAIHGTLHLVGFDDLESLEKRRMRRAEKKYLAVYDGAASA